MVCVGFCRPRVGTILGVNGAVLGYVGTFCFMFWQFWAILGAVSSMQGVSKKHREYQQKIHFLIFLLMVFAPFFCYFCCSLFGYAALGLCLPDLGLLLGHSRLFQRPVGLMLNHVAVSCGCVSFSLGTSWDHIGFVLGHIKPCWHHIELTLNHFALFWELFRPCTAFARNTVNTGKIVSFLMVFASLFWLFVLLSFLVCCT